MKRFVAHYFFWLVFLFLFFYADTSFVSRALNDGQTHLTLWMLEPFLKTGQIQGIDIIINPYYKIIITQACNGMIPVLFLAAAILSYPSTFIHKLLWLIIGYVLYNIINVFRILLVVYFVGGKEGRGNFYWSHDLLGNALLMVLGLTVFILFIKTSKRRHTL